MGKYPALILHNNKAHAVKRFHPWVFSGAVKKKEGNPDQGDIVEVYADSGEYLGIGHFGTGSVSARLFAFEKVDNLTNLWKKRFISAFEMRKAAGLTRNTQTNAYRLINAEGDGMPGLIVDFYNGTAVIQAHSKGMHRERDTFVEILKYGYAEKLKAVYDKSTATLHHKPEGDSKEVVNNDGYLWGSSSETTIRENGHQFYVNWETGQKTGFFLDQRDNRQLLARYAPGKKVLNTFCYSGGFSVYAAHAGASAVHSVDSSEKAIKWTDQNIALNVSNVEHKSFAADVFDFLKGADKDYDLIVLDPPAFAKGQAARHSAIKAYTRLNYEAFKRIKPSGIVFTFSCSQVVDPDMFKGAVTSAAIESSRNIRILHHLTQPADHPVSIFNPEGLYLKGLVVHVE